MKMNYLQGNKFNFGHKKSFQKGQIIALIIILIIIIILFLTIKSSLVNGVQKLRAYIVNGTIEPRFVPRNLSEQALIKSLEVENEYLKSLLGKYKDDSSMILAGVILRPPRTPFDSLIIDAGSDQDLLEGDLVFADVNYAIGVISSVSEKTSTVALFSSSGQKIDGLINSDLESSMSTSTKRVNSLNPVTIEGRGGGNFYIKLPKNIKVKSGDPIIWPGAETVLLGVVEVVDSTEGDAYSQIYFKSPINMNSLRYVQVKKTIH